jgi:hypothetical protein
MCGFARPESITEFRKDGLPYLFYDLGYGLLDKP